MNNTINSSMPVRRIWPIAMMIAGMLCCVRPLIAWILSWHAKTLVEATSYNMVIGDWPLIPFGVMLTYLAVLFSKKRSKLFWSAVGCFVFSTLIGWMSFFVIGTLLCLVGFIAALNDFPKLRIWRVMVALICTGLSITIWIMSLSGMHWSTPRDRALVVMWHMKDIASILEAYGAQHHEFPPSTTDPTKRFMWKSISAMPTFTNDRSTTDSPANFIKDYDQFRYLNEERTFAYYRWDPNAYIMISAGPNCFFDIKPDDLSALKPGANGVLPEKLIQYRYDSTNGVISAGDIYMVGPMSKSKK